MLLREIETSAPPAPAPARRRKPLLRGWSHAVAAVGAIILTVLLGWLGRGDGLRLAALFVFGISTSALYTLSALYHLREPRRPARQRLMRTLDHAGIFIGIAGTYTPFCMLVLQGWQRIALLAAVWLCALAGIALKVAWPGMSRQLSTYLYVSTGWTGMLVLPAFWRALPPPALALLLLGGSLYTLGAAIYAWRWPDPFPRVFGYHEIFHLLVIGGSTVVTVVLLRWVVPGVL